MSEVALVTVDADDADLRLDRWFRRRFPGLSQGHVQKLIRTGQVRVDGHRAKADLRLGAGQTVRVPPLGTRPGPNHLQVAPAAGRPEDGATLRRMLVYEDEVLLVFNKPAGLAVQGGTGTARHLDGMLESLATDGERPRLVHRLDRATSGLLVVARTARSAAALGHAFRSHRVRKLYWALVAGVPPQAEGRIDLALAKRESGIGEKMACGERGQPARTDYLTVARAGRVATWLALRPLTGRTHQLRAHCAAIGTPILGDGKYGGRLAKLAGMPDGLMLHARAIRLPHPDGGDLDLEAPLESPVLGGFAHLGFAPDRSLPGGRHEDFP